MSSGMELVHISVALQLPPPLQQVTLTLKPDQLTNIKYAKKRLRQQLLANFGDIDTCNVSYCCLQEGELIPLPEMTAAAFATEFGQIHARGSDMFLQQIQKQVSNLKEDLRTLKQHMEAQFEAQQQQITAQQQQITAQQQQITAQPQQITALQEERPQLLDDQRRLHVLLRRDIAVRCRNKIALAGGQMVTETFFTFIGRMGEAWVEARGLRDVVALIMSTTIPFGDYEAHGRPLAELRQGLAGLVGWERGAFEQAITYLES